MSSLALVAAARPVAGLGRRECRNARRPSRVAIASSDVVKSDRTRVCPARVRCRTVSAASALTLTPRGSVATHAMAGNEPEDPTPFNKIPANYVWNAAGWEQFVKLAYLGLAALICNNVLFECFPYGFGTPPSPPELFSCQFAEMLVMVSGVILGAFNFGPQCGAQIKGGLKALSDVSSAKQRKDAGDFLGLVLLKIAADAVGLALLAAPDFMIPTGLPRSLGLGITFLGHSVFMQNCAQTYSAFGVPRPVPEAVRAVIAMLDRTLGFMALSVAYGTYSQAPSVALTSAVLFFAGAVYFSFENKLSPLLRKALGKK
jgi:hypothetical protein